MSLALAHRILIGAAIALSLLFGIYEVYRYRETGSALALVLAVGSFAALVGLCFYLRWFMRKMRSAR